MQACGPVTCAACGKPVSRDEIGLSVKLRGRGTHDYRCMECLIGEFRTTREKLEDMIRIYRDNGCTLFR